MDIVSRLRTYIDYTGMPVTQFADTCGIPRPSMSQLLSGRNKKVSNEFITKVHEAFPDLNVLWLMFGQGDMTVEKNISLSTPQKEKSELKSASQISADQPLANTVLDFSDALHFEPEKSGTDADINQDSINTIHDGVSSANTEPKDISQDENIGKPTETETTTPSPAHSVKTIVNIIVYYSDNSYEAFVPENVHLSSKK